MDKIKTGIIGATGYTGSELVRILFNHPRAEVEFITSESRKGEYFSDVHPFFKGITDYKLISANETDNYNIDLVFLALPHGISMEYVKKYNGTSFKIIDLSGDFRLTSKEVYKEWYNTEHQFPQGLQKAVFGLPEINNAQIKNAGLIANPGCYPTSSILGLAPLVKNSIIDTSFIIIDSKSGVTGAGIKAKPVNMFSNVNDNFKAYGLKNHRHTIEIQEQLSLLAGSECVVQFTPHLLPVDRGILSTIYCKPSTAVTTESLQNLYNEFYSEAHFVRMRNTPSAIKDVRGTNYCDIHVTFDERTNTIIIVSVIDNLVKGAAGQAVQNMNLMFGLNETTGLNHIPLNP